MATRKYENIIIRGDINVDRVMTNLLVPKLSEFCDVFDLENLIIGSTYVTTGHALSIDVILTNIKVSLKTATQ